ncbi:MAG TPA: heterodisulfide reductase-related iron-sulfur binding cluster [Acidimicrobiales bacterium]|nr:heterodisulfide reductase-related iron-sulfur binding cluster [Acidimicrobiales bacterium]
MAAQDEHPRQPLNLLGAGDAIADCVHCGFCLPACPTYVLWGEEMDSPRGRIHLADQVRAGGPLEGATVKHFDRCLSCMACVTACPSGVRYGEIIEAARADVEQATDRALPDRLARSAIFSLFPYPRRLKIARAALGLAQLTGIQSALRRPGVSRHLPAMLRAVDSVAPPVSRLVRLPVRLPATGPRRGVVGLLTGCVQSVFFSATNAATARVLAAEGFDVVVPKGQGCCGALSSHSGRTSEAARFATKTIETFKSAGVEFIVVNAAGCGSAMKDYSRLFPAQTSGSVAADWLSTRTRDLSELLASFGTRARRHPVPLKIAYHDACHLAHAQRIRAQPRDLLQEIPELQLYEIHDDLCCGSAGIYNLVQPDAAKELGDRKAAAVMATGAEVVVTTNPGCMMQMRSALLRAGSTIRILPLAQVLDISIRGGAEVENVRSRSGPKGATGLPPQSTRSGRGRTS